MAFEIPYMYGYIIQSCRTQTEVKLNHVNQTVHSIGRGEAGHRVYKRLNWTAVKSTTFQLTNRSFS
jgi:hypothetical protein